MFIGIQFGIIRQLECKEREFSPIKKMESSGKIKILAIGIHVYDLVDQAIK